MRLCPPGNHHSLFGAQAMKDESSPFGSLGPTRSCLWMKTRREGAPSTSSSFIFPRGPLARTLFSCVMEEKLDPWDAWTSPTVHDHMEGYFSLPLETLAALFVVQIVLPASETSQWVYISLFDTLSANANRKGSRPSHVYLVAAFSECLSRCRWNGRTMLEELGAESNFCCDLKFIAWGWVFTSPCFSLVQQLLIIFRGIKKKTFFFSVSSGIN